MSVFYVQIMDFFSLKYALLSHRIRHCFHYCFRCQDTREATFLERLLLNDSQPLHFFFL